MLADELNRASPKTQSALLEAMEESQVTVDATTTRGHAPYGRRDPKPARTAGDIPRCRTASSTVSSCVSRSATRLGRDEMEMLDTHGAEQPPPEPVAVASSDDIAAMVAAARAVFVSSRLKTYILELADATRRHRAITLGMSPRAALALLRASRAEAAASDRAYVTPDDILCVAGPVVAHRLVLATDVAGGRRHWP